MLGCVALSALSVWAASLPQDHDYQRVLRSWLAGRTEADYAVELKPLGTVAIANEPPEKQLSLWMLGHGGGYTVPGIDVVLLPAAQFLLSSIEGQDSVTRPALDPQRAMWLTQWNDPANPYFGSRAIRNRALAIAIVDMVMLDHLNEQQPKSGANRSDYLGGTLVWLAYPHLLMRDELPADVRAAYETGLGKFVARLEEWGPTGLMTDMDLFAPVGLTYAAKALRDPKIAKRAEQYSRRLFTDPGYFHPAGYFVDLGAFDVSYDGISLYWAAWAGLLTDWPFVREALAKTYRLKNHLTLPEPDGQRFGPTHFSSRTSADAAHDQWGWPHRDIGAAMITEEALCVARWPSADELQNARARLVSWCNQNLRQAPPATKPWRELHWTSQTYTVDYLTRQFFARRQKLEAGQSPLLKLPFARRENFVRAFEKAFLIAKFDDFGVIIHTGPVPKEAEKNDRMYGFSGGALSAFWTPSTGSVLLGRRAGHQGDKTWDRYEGWRLWPVHSVSGITADGKVFSSGRIANPKAQYRVGKRDATATVFGSMPKRNSAQGTALEGEIRYSRRFELNQDGLRIETALEGDGKDSLAELYEAFPVFLQDTQWQKDVPCRIEFLADGKWGEATATPTPSVAAVRVERFTGAIEIRFERPRRVRLSPEVWKDQYQSRATCRNVMIDLLENGGRPVPSGASRLSYRITAAP